MLSWGDCPVTWWIREPELRELVRTTRRNAWYQPDYELSASLELTDDLPTAMRSADLVLVAVPSQFVRAWWTENATYLAPDAIVLSASKGIEENTCATMDEVMREVIGGDIDQRSAFVSGPTFAKEMLAELPTAAVVAARNLEVAEAVQERISSPYFRAYTSNDVVGVELGGAVKNIMAIAAGIIDGLNVGSNARAALITRGLAEIRRLGVHLGAQPETFAGLAGVGDLVLTCTGSLSRNRGVGVRLGQGETLDQILDSMLEVAEGVRTTHSVHDLSTRTGVEMPIVEQVYRVLYQKQSPKVAITELMTRRLKAETQ